MGWLEAVKGLEDRVAALIPAKWKEAVKAAGKSKKLPEFMHAVASLNPVSQLISGAARTMQIAGMVPKTGAGYAKAALGTTAALGAMTGAAIAAPVVAGGAAVAAKKIRAMVGKPGVVEGLKRGAAKELGAEVRRRVRAKLPPTRRRRSAPARAGAAAVKSLVGRSRTKRPRRKSSKAPSAKQLEARRRFAEMARARAKARKG